MENKSQSQLIADVNLLHMQKRITEAERLRQIFAIREKFEKKAEVILTTTTDERQ